MKKIFLAVLIINLSLGLSAQNSDAREKFEKELANYFYQKKVEKTELINDRSSDKIYKLNIDEKFYGYSVLSSAKGRYDLFDFIVVYNTNKEVEYIKVLIYKSQYGQEITNKNWLKQFYKKTIFFVYGKDIQAISGATFSAESITNKINKLNEILTDIIQN
ncbi:MAG: hypothetical protein A2X13_08630 [Bacteroidetes bacterium GWC2_33_15]|nr:MAG: hypothetical protein A2X10_14525 [Bacteroidetes bacterium GWA2_33_15]OFX51319.1 MAG: hypothetical protein A2X13_08630 [Bacteroidetes bacterium GWC2_33_15]OFX65098.1 MAG: hypothetical protein A2X15_06795 [Bacteroidetes bacterium GWB2_32_14]OFX70695.1 MAG: hypothetical protein A2X14_11005 [Bacteroidetes bacterium GWD2_33_33]HAN18510.1 hypothetical protein [Bacteroidales bacterium]